MRKSKFTEEQIIRVLKEVDAGAKVQDVVRRLGITETTFYRWKSKYGGLEVSDAKRLRALEDENRKLKTSRTSRSTSRHCSIFSGNNGRARRAPHRGRRDPGGVRDEEAAGLPRRRTRAGDLLLPRASPGAGRTPGEAPSVRRATAALGVPAPPCPLEA
jgi:putative transposase